MKKFEDCTCLCHRDYESAIMHVAPCCEGRTNLKYKHYVLEALKTPYSEWKFKFVDKEEPNMKLTAQPTFTHEQFDKILQQTVEEIKNLALLKGGEYSGDIDRLANFRRNGEALGLDMRQIWGVYAAKHWDAIMQYLKDLQQGKERRRLESLAGRADDLIVYLILFKCMLEEVEKNGTNIKVTD